MINTVFSRTSLLAELESGPLGPYLPDLVSALQQQRYATHTIQKYLHAADAFGRWLITHLIALSEVNEAVITRYVSAFPRRKVPGYAPGAPPHEAAGLKHLLTLLRQQGVTPLDQPCSPTTPIERTLADYEQFLERTCGAAVTTRRKYLYFARQFLSFAFGSSNPEWSALRAETITKFVQQETVRRSGFGRKAPGSAIRIFLRYLVTQGVLPAGLEAAVPGMRVWKHASLPEHLTAEEVTRLLTACADGTAIGRRNHAILLLLARLGIRAFEAARLQVTDVDWRAGSVVIRARELLRTWSRPLGELQGELEKQRDRFARGANAYLDQTARRIMNGAEPLMREADRTLRLIRAMGDPPRVPKLDFERSKIGYYFKEVAPDIDLTPVISVVNQGAEVLERLKQLGVKLPTRAALEQLLPAELKNFDLSQIFPNFAGLDLSNLFAGLKIPSGVGNDNVKVTHGLDGQTRRAFVRADVNFPITELTTLFTIGPLSVQLPRANFEATSKIDAGLNGEVRRKVQGKITGDWQIVMSGAVLVKFRNTELFFDDSGGIRFSIKSQNIELSGVLTFISDAMKKFQGDDTGLSIGLLPDGFQSVLSLVLPDVQAGAFGITMSFPTRPRNAGSSPTARTRSNGPSAQPGRLLPQRPPAA
jgi:integrase